MYSNIKHILFIVLYLAVHLIGLGSADDEIKYDIQFDRVESFNGTDKFYKFQLNMTKKEDSKNLFTVDGSLELLQDFDDDWKMAIELFKLNETNEYESIFAFPKIGICNFMRTIYKRYFYEQMSEYSNLPHFDTCPVPGGQYEIKQFPFDMETFKRYKQLIEPGSYRLQNFLVHKNVAVSGIQFYGRVVENI